MLQISWHQCKNSLMVFYHTSFFKKIKAYFRFPFHRLWEIICKYWWYKWGYAPFNKTAVAVIDGRVFSGGLTDRFKGIISLYAWAKINNIPFKIQYTYPFNLTDYLLPNIYNWKPDEKDFVKAISSANIVFAYGEKSILPWLDKVNKNKQIHFYGNMDFLNMMGIADCQWGVLFSELFKPSNKIESKLAEIKKGKGRFISVVFRFQALLGDFHEYFYSPLAEDDRKILIDKCLEQLVKILKRHKDSKCLVTSDSVTFLKIVDKYNEVFIVPGTLVHMGCSASGTYEQYEKSFMDFFMLSESEKIYSVVIDQMYPSEFPLYASKLNNIPFERIVL